MATTTAKRGETFNERSKGKDVRTSNVIAAKVRSILIKKRLILVSCLVLFVYCLVGFPVSKFFWKFGVIFFEFCLIFLLLLLISLMKLESLSIHHHEPMILSLFFNSTSNNHKIQCNVKSITNPTNISTQTKTHPIPILLRPWPMQSAHPSVHAEWTN